jgi:hypothetical protein
MRPYSCVVAEPALNRLVHAGPDLPAAVSRIAVLGATTAVRPALIAELRAADRAFTLT